MNGIIKKLRDSNGESLAEVLAAILIIAVGMLMLSSLIYASSHMIQNGDAKIAQIYDGVNAMEVKEQTPRVAQLDIKRKSGTHMYLYVDIYQDETSALMSYQKNEGTN